jgi:hypothetical protein
MFFFFSISDLIGLGLRMAWTFPAAVVITYIALKVLRYIRYHKKVGTTENIMTQFKELTQEKEEWSVILIVSEL